MAIDCNTNNLQAQAKCFQCLPGATLQQIQTYLLCQILNNGGTGGGGTCTSTSAIISGTDIDWSVADYRFKTLSGNTVFTFSNTSEARTITVILTNTAGNFSVTWPAGIRWTSGVQPVMVLGVRSDMYTFVMVNGIIWASYVQNLS
jgi:hypothetical protein